MDGGFVAIMFFITFFGAIFGISYFFFTTRNRERLALIEKNADPAIFKTEPVNILKKFSIKLGMLAIGVGLGILVGNRLWMMGMDEDISYASMVFIFGGAALVASYFVARRVKD